MMVRDKKNRGVFWRAIGDWAVWALFDPPQFRPPRFAPRARLMGDPAPFALVSTTFPLPPAHQCRGKP